MAITGDIADLPLPDLLNMIRFKGGTVTLTDTPRATEIVLCFAPGYVTGFSIERQVIKVESQVVDRLVAVAALPIGQFKFEQAANASMRGSVRIPIDRLALFIVQKVDEINITKESLPVGEQIFRLRDEEMVINDVVKNLEESDLVNFVLESKQLLYTGVSAERLAEIHQIGVDLARFYLYKLNLLGVVVPAKRDSLWASLDSALQPKTSGIRLVRPDGQLAMPRPPESIRPPKRDTALFPEKKSAALEEPPKRSSAFAMMQAAFTRASFLRAS